MAAPAPNAYLFMLALALILPIALAVTRYLLRPHPNRGVIHSRPRSYVVTDSFYYSAIVAQTVMCSMLIYRTSCEIRFRNGLIDMHDSKLSSHDIELAVFHKMTQSRMLLILFLSGCLYYSSLCLVRGAFLAFYWSLYTHAGISTKWIKVAVAMTVTLTLVTLILGLGWCRPIQRNWSSDYEDYKRCTTVYSLTVRAIATSLNVLTDLAIILLPISLINRLTLGPRETTALFFVYSIGLLSVVACITSMMNLKYSLERPNSLESVRLIEMWSTIESTSAIFAFSLPAFKKYILRRLGTYPPDRVRAMRRVEDEEQQEQPPQQGEGQLQAGLVGAEQGNKDVNRSGGSHDTPSDPPSARQRGGVWSRVAGSFGGQKNKNTIKLKGDKNGFPSFVRGSLVGGAGWIGPKLGDLSLSGGSSTMDNSRNRRRRTLDDIELTSFDDYEDAGVSDGHEDQNDRDPRNNERERERERGSDTAEIWSEGSSSNILGAAGQAANWEIGEAGAEGGVGGTNQA